MSLSAAAISPAASDYAPTRESGAGDDQASASFAGILAGAMNTPAPKPPAEKARDGTSELDASDSSNETGDTKADGSDAATSATSSATSGIVRSLGALNPELQAKLARVISRVREETGHTVSISETYRSQARQNELYAQGRDASGPVVTWTQNSKHTQGRAVDVLLDGGNAGSSAYSALQRIANEEGLRTLGARDPGHLELAGAGANSAASDSASALRASPADVAGSGQVSIARLAQVAQVAEVKVARPAQAARVATVARPGSPGAAPVSISGVTGAQANRGQSNGSQLSSQSDSDKGDSTSQGDQRGGYGALSSAFTLRDHQTASVSGIATGTTAAERTARVIASMEDAPARPLSQLTMSVDAGNGATDRIHVALRGSTLNTTIDASDARAAQSMSSRTNELVRALSRDGIEVESLRVRAAAGTSAPTAPQSGQSSSDSSASSRFERGNQWEQHDRQRSQSDRRQQQRDQRGGQNT